MTGTHLRSIHRSPVAARRPNARPPAGRPSRLRLVLAALVGVGAAGAVAANLRWIAGGEAWLSARFVDGLGLAEARSSYSTVIFPLDERWVGFMVTLGCSVGLLLIPPVALAAFLMFVGRVSVSRATVCCAVTAVLLVAVNQLRLAAVVGSMRLWGFEQGYERSHVLIGSVITTLGVVGSAILFVVLLTRGRAVRNADHVT
ncbi:hypothetical protein [Plantactinospora endophytica]|uniref:Exosortase/archaeosortase family protein n=1 Tax=Plantactinospora endophytica TaxID=673535 RepID=A0ABQ4E1F2_9ACTN|nr:hypothetical protein [Plantactinospora endophytica]GIG88500.1 hypothetical protein Pen02_34360 [Plantactinospora endophytica]